MKYTQVTMTQIQDSIDKKVRRGRPSGMHELSPSSKTNKINEKPNQTLIYEQVIESWRSVGECAEERGQMMK